MSETAILEPTQHRMKQQTVGYKQDKKEGSKLGGLYTSDGRQGCATLETLRAELPLILAQTPSTSASHGISAADRALCVFYFLGSQHAKGWASITPKNRGRYTGAWEWS